MKENNSKSKCDSGSPADLSSGLSHKYEEPIAALCSGHGAGAIAIIRVSGVGAFKCVQKILFPISDKPLRYGIFRRYNLVNTGENGEIIDESMAVFFKGPRSYTGQDSVEINCHGSPFVIKTILSLLFASGARPAEPGEFTRRAFLNGKLDLTAAEGVRELIEAQSHQQWIAARYLMDGKLSSIINDLRDSLINALAYLEASIDFPEEEDVQGVNRKVVREKVGMVARKIECLVSSYHSGRVASEGMKVALIGEPNAGKSTLLNLLLGKDRAIVTEVAGTTRDYIEESCLIKGRLVRLVDTAGVRSTNEVVEKLGISATKDIARNADLVLILIDAESVQFQFERMKNLALDLGLSQVVYVVTKMDLCKELVADVIGEGLFVSAHTGYGMEQLLDLLAKKVDQFIAPLKEASFVTSVRQLNALMDARKYIDNYYSEDEAGNFEECLGFELQSSIRSLSSIIGKVDNEDILDKIFGEFCIGK